MAGRRKAVDATLSSSDLESQIKEFLKKGGEVAKIPRGKSGVILNKGSTYSSSKTKK